MQTSLRTALGLLASLFIFTSCTPRETPVEEGIRTQTLLVGNQNEPATLDPALIDAATDMNISVALFEGLTCYDEKTGGPVPGVAERWDISPDGLTYTFHRRRLRLLISTPPLPRARLELRLHALAHQARRGLQHR